MAVVVGLDDLVHDGVDSVHGVAEKVIVSCFKLGCRIC